MTGFELAKRSRETEVAKDFPVRNLVLVATLR